MKRHLTSTLIAVGALSLAAAVAGPAGAQGAVVKYAGQAKSSVAGCPNIIWRLAQDPNGAVHGMVWYSDLSGMSQATGTAQGGVVRITLKSAMGNGPVGTAEGKKSTTGTSYATLTGEGCANMHMVMKPIPNWGYGG
jgi:hypothetical protein